MRTFCRLTMVGPLLVCALALGQADQPTTAQPTAQQPSAQQPTIQQPAHQPPAKPLSALDNAAQHSRQLLESAPAVKVYTNQDLSNPEDASSPATDDSAAVPSVAQPATLRNASHPFAQTADDPFLRKAKTFEAQGKIFQNQIRVEKGKIAGIQNHITSLKRQFANWRAGFAQENEALSCWTSLYGTYKDYCDTGRNLKAQYDASLRQLAQEKNHLDQMQENIRHKGYGNAVYDPD